MCKYVTPDPPPTPAIKETFRHFKEIEFVKEKGSMSPVECFECKWRGHMTHKTTVVIWQAWSPLRKFSGKTLGDKNLDKDKRLSFSASGSNMAAVILSPPQNFKWLPPHTPTSPPSKKSLNILPETKCVKTRIYVTSRIFRMKMAGSHDS